MTQQPITLQSKDNWESAAVLWCTVQNRSSRYARIAEKVSILQYIALKGIMSAIPATSGRPWIF